MQTTTRDTENMYLCSMRGEGGAAAAPPPASTETKERPSGAKQRREQDERQNRMSLTEKTEAGKLQHATQKTRTSAA
jgi:hypothetical protein